MSRALLKTYNQTPRKVRLVTDLVKGKSVSEALSVLKFLPRRSAEPIAKLIKSAAANAKTGAQSSAKNLDEKTEELRIRSIIVESAGMQKKYMPRARGSASLIRRRRSRVRVDLENKIQKSRADKLKLAHPNSELQISQ